MALSPGHKFGQIIGDVLEAGIVPLLSKFCKQNNLFLDKRGPRKSRSGNKLTWKDSHGNSHDLDFVIEKDGTENRTGNPVAFIEVAWRRYTKHSRNKAQEIQGAILPLAETYSNHFPFIGAILAGVFTGGAVTQLRSLGFTVLYFPYESVIEAFRTVHIDAAFDEITTNKAFNEKIKAWELLPDSERNLVAKRLLDINKIEVVRFMGQLEISINRQISSIKILAMHGTASEWTTVDGAVFYIKEYTEDNHEDKKVLRYEIEIIYNNGNQIDGKFTDKESALKFLGNYKLIPKTTDKIS